MVLSIPIRRPAIAAIFGGAVAGAMLCGSAPLALADPPPGCTAADRAQVMSGVSSAKANYLFAHPDVNAFFSSLAGQPRDAKRTQIQNYLNANPTVQNDLRAIRQPMTDLRNRCGSFGAQSGGTPAAPAAAAPPAAPVAPAVPPAPLVPGVPPPPPPPGM